MKKIDKIKAKISISFIIINICLFNVNTSIALQQRPYLPATSKWPGATRSLSSIVAEIQRNQKQDNSVIWVDHNSPYFSKAGLVSSNVGYGTSYAANTFKGLQDIDKPLDSFDHFELIGGTTNITSNVKHDEAEDITTPKDKQIEQYISSASSSSRGIERPLLLVDGSQVDSIVCEQHNPWLYLDVKTNPNLCIRVN